MVRNWWVGLAMLHNAVRPRAQRHLRPPEAERHPDWDDDRLFNVARLVNAAVMAKIHSIEWTPAILPNHGLDLGAQLELVRDAHLPVPQARATARRSPSTTSPTPSSGGLVGNQHQPPRRSRSV